MTSWEIILVLAGAPLAIMVLLGLLTLGPSLLARRERYHPGQQWNHQPVWWTADPDTLGKSQVGHHDQPGTGATYGGCRGDW